MPKKTILFEKYPHFIHGADYNPEQWKDRPDILEQDIALMKKAHMNSVTLGMFSWSSLEPVEGMYDFSFMDQIMNRLRQENIAVVLSTPSGARPAWLSQKYPEVLRVLEDRRRILHGARHNHCYSSRVYRTKVFAINSELAKRYGQYENVILWHVSNEYEGACYCEECQEAFRLYLMKKYHHNLDALNHAWWTPFWSHTYSKWSQIEAPSSLGEMELHGLNLDWKRFVTYQTINFMESEIVPLKMYSPHIPITTNFHQYTKLHTDSALNYWDFAEHLDIISWDNYPYWNGPQGNETEARSRSLFHDMNRSFKKGKPFLMMESSPSATNWQPVAKLRDPGLHELASVQAIAHGSESVQYFQFRKSRGSCEKFHGAVVGHDGRDDTRIFKEVSKLGETLSSISEIAGTKTISQVALLMDFENAFLLQNVQGFINADKGYEKTCHSHYRNLSRQHVSIDILDFKQPLCSYKLVVAPMAYMTSEVLARNLKDFVSQGGILLLTYSSGIVNESDLCHLGGFPGPLRELAGLWVEETDSLYAHQSNEILFSSNHLHLTGTFQTKELCEILRLETAQPLASYQHDFYKETPAFTYNSFGKGHVYYLGCRMEDDFLNILYQKIIAEHKIQSISDLILSSNLIATCRSDGEIQYIFLMNFSEEDGTVQLSQHQYQNLLTKEFLSFSTTISPLSYLILKKEKK